ncbi:heparinase [Aquimarina sp. BL5]|uniref:heparinase II/III family protein n=1 Tax=Aquimarina sp. BL5 TaxID=1714860 RepID=UPI000E4F995D|nr:heparinase II/III family protein [Aquimarina sp. BL5]AXT51715.1 heparinase [Aquimarina sp. BL5]RKN08807.1 heparinase [Aquimarina sp. BL5]
MTSKSTLLLFLFCSTFYMYSQQIPINKVITNESLYDYLREDVKKELDPTKKISQKRLAEYLRNQFSKRYFYDWKTFNNRFDEYNTIYPQRKQYHQIRANDHISKFSDATHWKLPFNYLNGKPVNAYALRHLARQHKMVDIGFQYHYSNQDTTLLRYFTNQMQSLNQALEQEKYEKIVDGNGVYEAFRSGYRVLNWFRIHAMFLSQKHYSDADQLRTIATLLQHGAHLFEKNAAFKSGNHQTRGLSALAIISILLRDFVDTDKWYTHSMTLLKEHLDKEINEDGFQFERSVHYHMSDINNYYYIYQLAKISDIKIDQLWTNRLKSLFITLSKIAYPDTSAPVLQDDTDIPWAEKNDISATLTLGYLLFEDPLIGYFAKNTVDATTYWFLNQQQLNLLKNIQKQAPKFRSSTFPETGYYIMREGWDHQDNMMIISSGLDDKKPDHQHGDMLGIQAMANGHVILPNYQVRYSLKDLELFKNSMVKNVALVDDELQGKEYTSNKGGSGFGKFKLLPKPKTIAWKSTDDLDVFMGSHNGFENIGVRYSRQIVYIKNDFWIIKDNFNSKKAHSYKQVWQGHYSKENTPDLLRSSFDDGSGCDIFQLREVDTVISSGARGKQWSVVSKNDHNTFSFITLVYPFSRYSDRIDESLTTPKIKDWILNTSPWNAKGPNVISLSNKDSSLFFDAEQLSLQNIEITFSEVIDVFVKKTSKELIIQSIDDQEIQINISGVKKQLLNGEITKGKVTLKPGDILKCSLL